MLDKAEGYRKFWTPLEQQLKDKGLEIKVEKKKANLRKVSFGIPMVECDLRWKYRLQQDKTEEAIVDLRMKGRKERNKEFFDMLKESKSQIEQQLGYELIWNRLDDQIASSVSVRRPGSIEDSSQHLEKVQQWMYGSTIQFSKVFPPYLERVRLQISH